MRPFPSSPHWPPTTTMTGIKQPRWFGAPSLLSVRREYRGRGRRGQGEGRTAETEGFDLPMPEAMGRVTAVTPVADGVNLADREGMARHGLGEPTSLHRPLWSNKWDADYGPPPP